MRGAGRLAIAFAVTVALAGACMVGSRPAGAAPGESGGKPITPTAVIGGDSTCPRPDAVWAELTTLVPRERLEARLSTSMAGQGGQPPVTIADLGAGYRVQVGGRLREHADDARDCSHRARVAAVFVALTIDPPDVVADGAAPADTVEAEAAGGARVTPTPTRRWRLELGPAVSAGFGSGENITSTGASVVVAAGGDRLAMVAGVLVLAPGDLTVADVRLRQLRLPFEIAARTTWSRGRLSWFGEAGGVAALVSARGTALASNRQARSVELGAWGAAGLRWAASATVAPFVLARIEGVPRPSEVFALPTGVAGHTPRLWLGAAAGVSWGLP